MTIQGILSVGATPAGKFLPKTPATKRIQASLLSGKAGIVGAAAEEGGKGFIGKIFGGIKKGLGSAWGWAKTHRAISIPVAIAVGVLGITAIAKKSAENKKMSVQA